ncbi:hypothetical protein ES703_102730 [subsurface metagenome]
MEEFYSDEKENVANSVGVVVGRKLGCYWLSGAGPCSSAGSSPGTNPGSGTSPGSGTHSGSSCGGNYLEGHMSVRCRSYRVRILCKGE